MREAQWLGEEMMEAAKKQYDEEGRMRIKC